MQTPARRFETYLKEKKIKVSHAEKAMGVSNGLLGKIFKTGKGLTTETIERILKAYPDITFEWLTTGKKQNDQFDILSQQSTYKLKKTTMEDIIRSFTEAIRDYKSDKDYLKRKLDEADVVIHNYIRSHGHGRASSKAI